MSTETQVGPPDGFEEEQRGRLVKSMRLFDLVFFGITTVVSLDTRGASRAGASRRSHSVPSQSSCC
jgi:hypothetical protein